MYLKGRILNEYYEIVIPFNNEKEAQDWSERLKVGSMLPVQLRKIIQNW